MKRTGRSPPSPSLPQLTAALSTAVIVGIVAGALVFCAAVAVLLRWYCSKTNKEKKTAAVHDAVAAEVVP